MNDTPNRPQSATELQAVVTLKAARDVAETIEVLRRGLRGSDLSRARRRALKDDLLEAAERLCNLLDLLMSWLQIVSPSIREPLDDGIQELRGKLLATGIKLIGDRTQRIIDQAAGIVALRDGLPIGISARLSETMAILSATIDVLGGLGAMPVELQDKIEDALRLIVRLRAMEDDLGLLKEIGRGR